mgnify:CR=1 FL=1
MSVTCVPLTYKYKVGDIVTINGVTTEIREDYIYYYRLELPASGEVTVEFVIKEIGAGFWQTIYMTLVSTLLAYAIGIPIGVILNVSSKEGIKPNKVLNSIVGIIVNILRSVPFLILAVFIIPFTRLIDIGILLFIFIPPIMIPQIFK